MSQPSSTSRASSGCSCSFELRDRLEIAELQLRHAAAALERGDRHGDAVVLEDRGQILAQVRLVAVAVAGGEQHDLAAASRPPACAASAGCVRRGVPLAIRACCGTSGTGASGCTPSVLSSSLRPTAVLLTALTISATTGMPAMLPTAIRRAQNLVAQRATGCVAELERLGAQHQVRKVDVPRMRRHVRTLRHVAHVAQVAVVDDVPVDLLVDAVDFAGRRFIDGIEQRRERVAQTEAAAAAVADVEDRARAP